MTSPASIHDESAPVRRKSTLFCRECDHSSPMDDDWNRRLRDTHLAYVCPVCETTITKRPLPDGSPRDRRTNRAAVAWQRALHATVKGWRVSVGVGLASVVAMAILDSTAHRRR